MKISAHKYSKLYPITTIIFSFFVIGFIGLVIYGAVNAIVFALNAPPVFSGASERPLAIFLIPLLCLVLPALIALISALIIANSMYPSISLSHRGLKIHTLIGSSRWIPLNSIKRIRFLKIGSRELLIVCVPELSILFALNGLLFGIVNRGFLISSGISRFNELNSTLQTNRPDLFR